jgi:glycosyltransferase involved in cell wall biosynthesis
VRKWFETRLEKKTMKPCKYIIAATPMILDKQKELHNKPTSVIYNGFDEGNLNIPSVELTKKFTITYTGTIYQYKQDPEKFLKALSNIWGLMSIRKIEDFYENVEVRFYGQKYGWLQDLINKYGLEDIVHQYGKISRTEVTKRQHESHVLLTFNWEDEAEKGVCPLKFFEYLAAQRPILATGGIPVDAVQTLIDKTESGVYCHNVEQIEIELKRLYDNYLNGKNDFISNEKEVMKFSYRNLAKQFANVLDEVTK